MLDDRDDAESTELNENRQKKYEELGTLIYANLRSSRQETDPMENLLDQLGLSFPFEIRGDERRFSVTNSSNR